MGKQLFRDILKLVVFVFILVLIVVKVNVLWLALHALAQALTPVLLGVILAFVLRRPFAFFREKLEKTKVRPAATVLAAVFSYLILLAVVAAIIAFIVPQIVSSFTRFSGNFSLYFRNVQVWLSDLILRFNLDFLQGVDLLNLGSILQNLLSRVAATISGLSTQVISFTGSMVSAVVDGFLGFIFSIYLLAGSRRLIAQARRLVVAYLPEKASTPVLEVARLSATTFTNFITGQITEACILGGLCFVGMCIFRFDYAPLISVMVGVSALIPIVGAILGALVSALLLLMISPLQALGFLIYILVLQQLENNLIYPKVVGRSIGLPSIWVLLAVTVGGGLFGFWGLLLSVPVVSVLYTLLQRDMRRRLKRKANRME